MALWRNPDGYDQGRGSVKSWLMGMVHHRAVDLVRREESYRRRAERTALQAIEAESDHADDVIEQIGLPDERRRVRQALDDLPQEQRRVLELMYFEGRTQSQIAEMTGLPLGTVKSRTLLGMRRLRTALVEDEP